MERTTGMHVRILMILLLPILLAGSSCAEPEDKIIVKVKKSDQGWLGVSIQDMTSKLAKKKGMTTDEGAYVMDVVKDSPAGKAGIEDDDVIVEFDDKTIADADDLVRAVRKADPESRAKVVVMRNDQRKTLFVQVGKKSKPNVRTFGIRGPHWSIFSSPGMYGLTLMTLNKQLGEYFGAPRGRGVLVQEVDEESAAEKAGFKAGDVIVNVGEESIRRIDDIRWALDEYKEGDRVEFGILRKGTQRTLNLSKDPSEISGFHWHHGDGLRSLPEDFDFHFEGLEDMDIEILEPDEIRELEKIRELEETRETLKGRFRELQSEWKQIRERVTQELKRVQEQVRRELKQVFT
jgi:membrane-associated protease RseP (regulator of RpoE activity)